MTIYGKTLELNENTNDALYNLYEMKRETLAFNEGGNKYGYENLLEKYVMPAIAKRNLILEDIKALLRPLIAEKFASLTSNPEYKNNPDKFMDFLRGALDVGEKAFDWLTDRAFQPFDKALEVVNAGLDLIAYSEWEQEMRDTHELNFQNTEIIDHKYYSMGKNKKNSKRKRIVVEASSEELKLHKNFLGKFLNKNNFK